MRGIRAGARASRDAEFTEFVQAASPSLLRAALVLLDSREDAEDALQVTLLRTYRRWEQAKQAPQAYARAVLVNACRERWRHRRRHPEISRDLDELANVVSFAEAVDRRHVVVRVLRQRPGDGLAGLVIARHRRSYRRRVAGAVSLVVLCAGIGVPLGLSGPSGKPEHRPGQRPDQHTGSVSLITHPRPGTAMVIQRPIFAAAAA